MLKALYDGSRHHSRQKGVLDHTTLYVKNGRSVAELKRATSEKLSKAYKEVGLILEIISYILETLTLPFKGLRWMLHVGASKSELPFASHSWASRPPTSLIRLVSKVAARAVAQGIVAAGVGRK